MLLDVLGMMVGFAAIMALFSLVVTGLVQATQSMVKLRARNLATGLAHFMKVLPKGARAAPETVVSKLTEALPMEGKPTEVTKAELASALVAAGAEAVDIPDETFKRFEQSLSARFRLWTKWLSFGWGLGIAFYFQLSTPELVNALLSDAELREKAVKVGEELLKKPAPKALDDYSTVSGPALERLGEKHPELKERLEEVSGRSKSRAGSVAELRLVLSDLAPQELGAVAGDYEKLLDGSEDTRAATDMKAGAEARATLSGLDLQPWAKGKAFYVGGNGLFFGRLIGVLLTALLLTLGAPFWFEKLRELAGLRDVFAGPKKQGS